MGFWAFVIFVGGMWGMMYLGATMEEWLDSDNKVKQNIGCTWAIILAIICAIITVVMFFGALKDCVGGHDDDDYYEVTHF